MRGERYRIRTRVLGLEIQGDIQATLIALGLACSQVLHEVHLNGRAHFGHLEGVRIVVRSQVKVQFLQVQLCTSCWARACSLISRSTALSTNLGLGAIASTSSE